MTENDPKPIPRKTPKKKGEGPSMREQILARKRAAAQAEGATEPAAEVAPKKSAAKAEPEATAEIPKGGVLIEACKS